MKKKTKRILDFLFNTLQFKGCSTDYYNPENSIFSRILIKKRGIPISLSVLFILIANRKQLFPHGINFPRHFLTFVEKENSEKIFVDCFTNTLYSKNQLEDQFGRVEDATLAKCSTIDICTRMCRNLLGKFSFGASSSFHADY